MSRRPSVHAIRAAIALAERPGGEPHLNPRLAKMIGRQDLGWDKKEPAPVTASIDGPHVPDSPFAPEDCRKCGAPTNNASGQPCADH